MIKLFKKMNDLPLRVQIPFYSFPVFFIAGWIFLDVLTQHYQHLLPRIQYYMAPFLISMILMFLITPLVSWVAIKLDYVDSPDITQIKDKLPTPYLGGLAVYSAFMITLLIFGSFSAQDLAIIIGATIIFVVGTMDDIMPLSSKVRLVAQVTASLVVISQGLIINTFPRTSWGLFVSVIVTLIWIIGIINAMNFMDGADGLAPGIGLIAAIFFGILTLYLGQNAVCLISVVLSGSCLGFLFFNFKPAKIYLGDGGSTLLGYILATISLYGEWSEKGFVIALGIPVLILGVLIFDMIYITISRIRNGHVHNFKEWLDYRGYDHFHHRLIHLGLKEDQAVIFIYLICTILGLSATVLGSSRVIFPILVLLTQAFLIFLMITILMLLGRDKQA
jgi:UDP-GlcNAc:undecaprenyl-phosphate GlcNAc-1-phosphate transferase